MFHHKEEMWRIEFRSNLTRADALSLPLAYMLETQWADGVRWLGMLFRTRLTALELEHIDTFTWGELKNLEPFMKGLFDETWNAPSAEMSLGSAVIAAKYPVQSALHFAHAPHKIAVDGEDHLKSFRKLYDCLLGRRDDLLMPALAAPVLPMKKRAAPIPPVPPVRPDLEIANRAA